MSGIPHREIQKPIAVNIAALGNADWRTRWQAAQTLGELDDARAVQPLVNALQDSNQWVRIVAAEALGQIGDSEATRPLMYALDDESIWVRRACVVALGQIGDEQATPPLMNRLLDPPSNDWPEELRDSIARAMGTIGGLALETLRCALDDPDPWVSSAAARALGLIGDPHSIAPLTSLIEQKNNMVRSAATQALANIADVQAVRAALSTDEAPGAFWKLMALKEIGESTLSQLRGLLNDPEERIRAQAAKVLSRLGDEGDINPLINTFRAEARTVPANGQADVSQRQGSETRTTTTPEVPNGIDPLITALGDPEAQVRLAAAESLGKIGDSSVIPALSEALRDADSGVRVAAARALGEIGHGN